MTKLNRSITFLLILTSYMLNAQNVGIGVPSPVYNLDVLGTFRIQNQNVNTTAGLWLDGSLSMPTRSFIGTYNDSHFGMYGIGGAGWNFLVNNNNNNVGIGGVNPDFRLDINGRMRIQHNGATSGIWFDGTSFATRSFIGNVNDDYIGIWGSGGAGWNFAMNVANGNTGIGTTTPTSRLDLNGLMRIRSNAPMRGSILTSKDANGNAEWVNPVLFKVESTLNNTPQPCPNSTWTKVLFNQSPVYNVSTAYQINNSIFVAPSDGVYEFNASVAFLSFANNNQSIRFILRRNGVNTTIAQAYNKGVYRDASQGYFSEPAMLSIEYNLLAGDQIWVEAWMATFNGVSETIAASITSTWFSGQLLVKL